MLRVHLRTVVALKTQWERRRLVLQTGSVIGFMVTFASLHILRRHETIVAQALVRPRRVGALAAITDLQGLFALIDVCAVRTEAAAREDTGDP